MIGNSLLFLVTVEELVLEQSVYREHVSAQNIGDNCVLMLGKSQCKIMTPRRWKTSKVSHLIALVFVLKPGGTAYLEHSCLAGPGTKFRAQGG